MKKPNEVYESELTYESVDEVSNQVRKFLNKLGLSSGEILRYAMTTEEILLKTLDQSEKQLNLRLEMGKRFLNYFISLEIDGEPINVFLGEEKEQGFFGGNLLKNLGISPEYNYTTNNNAYLFRVKRKTISPLMVLLITLAASFLFGFLGLLLPDNVRTVILGEVLNPLHDTFLNVLGCIAGPMVFLAVAWGIYGIGDAATLKQLGKRILMGYIGSSYIVVIVFGGLSIPFFNLAFSSKAGSGSELSEIFSMLLGIFPKNIFSPIVEGNTLQIIFLAVVIGIAMLFLGKKTTAVAKGVEQINYIVQFLIEFVSKLVPYFIFIVLLKLIWSDSISTFLKVGKLFVVLIVVVIIMAIGVILYTAIRNRVSPFLLIKKGLPVLLIALPTASSAAAFGTNFKVCRSEYGIEPTVASFGIPLGIVTFKPTTALSYSIIALFFAQMYDVSISPAWIFLMMFATGILALATPPIPGGALTSYTMLFTLLGIPPQALALALACDTLCDFICTGVDQFLLPLALLNQAAKLGMVDRSKLLKKTAKTKKG